MDNQTGTYSAFISHSSRDFERANEICASLEARGFRCFIAPRDLRAGHDYGSEIIRGIEESRCLVLLLSEAANQSPMVRNEVERAVSKRKPVFPVRIEDVIPSKSLEFFISSTHWLDAWTGKLIDHINQLVADISDDATMQQATAVSTKIARRRQMPKWVAMVGGFVTLVLAIVVGVRVSLMGTTPRPVENPNSNPPPANVPPPNPQIVLSPQGPATRAAPQQRQPRNVVPAPMDPMAQMMQLAKRPGRWLICQADGRASIDLQAFYPVVKRIRFGESTDKLDQVIEIPPPPAPVTTLEQVATYRAQYRLSNIPYRVGAKQIFNQLEFTDGTTSEVRPAEMDRSSSSVKRIGIRLKLIDSQPTAPIVFGAYPSDAMVNGEMNWDANDLAKQFLQVTPFNPAGTQTVQFATDDDAGFYDAKATGADLPDFVARTFAVSANHKTVRLRFKGADGKDLGTFAYSLDDVKPLAFQAVKSAFVEHLDDMVACMRVNFEWPLPPPAEGAGPIDSVKVNATSFIIESKGLSFVEKSPIIAVFPSTKSVAPFFASRGPWSVVKEVAVGDNPQRLNQSEKMDYAVAGQPRGSGRMPLWHAVLPVDTKEVYFQIHYTDGTSSDVRRLEIQDVKPPG